MATLAQRLAAVVQAIGVDMKARMLKADYDADGDGMVDAAKSVAWAGVTGAPRVREVLTAARTYYVRADGNDANDGSGDSAAAAFKTISRAVKAVQALDCGQFRATVSVGPGTFAETVYLYAVLGSQPPQLRGAGSSTIITASYANWPAISALDGARWDLSNFQLQNFSAGISATMGSVLTASGITFGPAPSSGYAQMMADRRAIIYPIGMLTVAAGAAVHALATADGLIDLRQAVVTLGGTPSFSTCFAAAEHRGLILAAGMSFSGSAVGPRYKATGGGGISVGGAAATFLPGNAAGTVTTQGWYA